MAVSDMNSDQHYFCAVSDLHKAGRLDTKLLREVPVLYRWWFPEDSAVMDILREYARTHPEDGKMSFLLSQLKERTLPSSRGEDKKYCALYLGKSTNGRKRFANHIKGPLDQSALRRSIRALLRASGEMLPDAGKPVEERISSILSDCYWEWTEMAEDPELVDSVEIMAISVGHYPLNIDGNHSLSEDWKLYIHNK